MTRAEYDEIGGVEGALAKRAQAIFDAATDGGRNELTVALFRRLFTRLVALGEDAEDTRRIVGRDELGPNAWALTQKLADENNRLVVTSAPNEGKETAEVVHEALIRNWPTMMEWLNLDRAFITWRNRLKPRLDEWRANPSDQGTQLRGGQLVTATDWLVRRREDLNEEEKAFISNGMAALEADKTKREHETFRSRALLTATSTVGAIISVLFSLVLHFSLTKVILTPIAGLIGFIATLVLALSSASRRARILRYCYLVILLLTTTVILLIYVAPNYDPLYTIANFSISLLLIAIVYASIAAFAKNVGTVLLVVFPISAVTSGIGYYYIHYPTLYWLMSSDVLWFIFIISVGALVVLDRALRAESS